MTIVPFLFIFFHKLDPGKPANRFFPITAVEDPQNIMLGWYYESAPYRDSMSTFS